MPADLVSGRQTGRRMLQSSSRSGRAVQERREEAKAVSEAETVDGNYTQ